MNPDLTVYLFAAALLSGAFGFFAAALMFARQVRRANLEGWKECTRYYQEERARRDRAARR